MRDRAALLHMPRRVQPGRVRTDGEDVNADAPALPVPPALPIPPALPVPPALPIPPALPVPPALHADTGDTGEVRPATATPGPARTPGAAPLAVPAQAARALVESVRGAVRGVGDSVELAVTTLVAGGHLLIEDVPGTGKTLLARALARSLDASFRRVQATPDLSAAEIVGSSVWEPDDHRFTFVPGPVFANVVLVDEINRTSPRTQAALMEAMDEAAVTVDGERHPLPHPSFVIATQNPIEQHGTFPLPEGQLDRFMMVLSLGYVDAATERDLIRDQLTVAPDAGVRPVLDVAGWAALREACAHVHVDERVLDYAVAVVRGTRSHPAVALGASSRAAVALTRCAQARSLLRDRGFVTPDDVRWVAEHVLSHRLVLRQLPAAGTADQRRRAVTVVREIVAGVSVPLLT